MNKRKYMQLSDGPLCQPERRVEVLPIPRRELWGLVAMVLALCVMVGGLLVPAPAVAQSSENACIKEKIGGNPPCTANDVRVGKMEIVGTPQSCTAGSDVTVPIKATIESGPDRWDIGLW